MSARGRNSGLWWGILSVSCVYLVACGDAPLPFEGRWTGTLLRAFECAGGGGSSSDVPVDWTIEADQGQLEISTAEPDCPTLTAEVLPSDATEARLDVARCAKTGLLVDGGSSAHVNTRTWTSGHLRLRDDGRALLVDMWEHDEGTVGAETYICDGLSFGALMLED